VTGRPRYTFAMIEAPDPSHDDCGRALGVVVDPPRGGRS